MPERSEADRELIDVLAIRNDRNIKIVDVLYNGNREQITLERIPGVELMNAWIVCDADLVSIFGSKYNMGI
jgi:hypothetical protein